MVSLNDVADQAGQVVGEPADVAVGYEASEQLAGVTGSSACRCAAAA